MRGSCTRVWDLYIGYLIRIQLWDGANYENVFIIKLQIKTDFVNNDLKSLNQNSFHDQTALLSLFFTDLYKNSERRTDHVL